MTSTALAAGDTNCPNGGSKFTAANGTTFACNGADGSGAALDQTGNSVFGTGTLTLTPTTGLTLVPGLTMTVTTTSGEFVYVSTDGGVQTTSNSATGFSDDGVAIAVDGIPPANGSFEALNTLNNGGVVQVTSRWSLSEVISLGPGTHTIAVGAEGLDDGGSAAVVSGGTNNTQQGTLTVLVLDK